MAHILVDTANTFFRARHVIRGDTSEKVGMAIHIMMSSIKNQKEIPRCHKLMTLVNYPCAFECLLKNLNICPKS